jgi:glutaredoxin
VTIFLLGEGVNFIMFLLIGQPNETLEKKTKQNKTSKHAPTINYSGSQEDMIIKGI